MALAAPRINFEGCRLISYCRRESMTDNKKVLFIPAFERLLKLGLALVNEPAVFIK